MTGEEKRARILAIMAAGACVLTAVLALVEGLIRL